MEEGKCGCEEAVHERFLWGRDSSDDGGDMDPYTDGQGQQMHVRAYKIGRFLNMTLGVDQCQFVDFDFML